MTETIPVLKYYDMGMGVTAFSSTRSGGCSLGNYASFNINRYCGDDEEHIRQNCEALCRLLNITDDRLIMPHQTHEARVACIDETFTALPPAERLAALEGTDALMTNLQGVCIGVSTADCIPVLLHDPQQGAVAAIHAGWRGTVARIVEKAVRTMTDVYASHPENIIAQIGPGISLDSFEVGQEVYNQFQAAGFNMEEISKKYSKWHIDLPVCNRQQLLSMGIKENHIFDCAICTYQHCDTYFSARRLGIHSGRIFTGILLTTKFWRMHRCNLQNHPGTIRYIY
jgi:YfiH family protein